MTKRTLNANERNCQLICSLGLDYIFDLDTDGEAWPEERKAVSENIGCDALNGHELDKRDQTEFILDAHENLTEASEDNLPRFRDVIDCLKKELDDSGSR